MLALVGVYAASYHLHLVEVLRIAASASRVVVQEAPTATAVLQQTMA